MNISRLLRPKSLAVLGGAWADVVQQQCRKLGFEGPIYRVHPRRAAAGEADVYPDLDSLPTIPDAAFVGVNRETTVEVMDVMNRLGVGGAVCFASGFNELHTDATKALTADLKKAAGDVPFLGPNCYGFINYFDRVSLWPDEIPPQKTPDRGIAYLSQSGTVGLNVIYADRSLPVGYLACVGNQTAVGFHDLIDAVLEDDRVSAIGMYVEGFPDLKKFAEAATRARDRGVPIVVIKAGRSDLARRTTHSHTGAMGGEDKYMDALFTRLGVARCVTLSEFMETLKLLHAVGPLAGDRVGLLGCSGGDMAMAADVIEPLNLVLPRVPQAPGDALRAVLGDRIAVANPLDFQTYIWHAPEKMYDCFKAMMTAGYDCTAMLLDHPDPDTCDIGLYEDAFDAYIKAAQDTGAKVIAGCSVQESIPAYLRDRAMAAGVAALQGMHETFFAIQNAAMIGKAWAMPTTPSLKTHRVMGEPVALTEAAAKAEMAQAGLTIPASREVLIAEAVTAAAEIGYPVALKASSATLAHKSEAGGVVLNLQTAEEVQAALVHLATLSDRVLVEQMIDDGIAELIIGVDMDDQFGPVVLIGAGGVMAELLDDVAILLPPLTYEDVAAAVSSLKFSTLLNGFRGRPAANMDSVIDAILSVAAYAESHASTLVELDVNPLIVRPGMAPAVAVDAFIRRLDPGDI